MRRLAAGSGYPRPDPVLLRMCRSMRWRWLPVALLTSTLSSACALSSSGGGGSEPGLSAEESAALRSLRALVADGSHLRAAEMADSLYAAWQFERRLSAGANQALWLGAVSFEAAGETDVAASRLEVLIVRASGSLQELGIQRLAHIRVRSGREMAALELMLEHPGTLNEESLRLMRTAAGSVTLVQLETLAARSAGRPGALLGAELAKALALAGRGDSAAAVARSVLEEDAWSADRQLARQVLAGEYREAARLRVGLVIPRTGRFAAAGQLVEEGARVALLEYARTAGALPVDLVIRDDSSGVADVGALVRGLEKEAVVAVVGPMRSDAFAAAARGRRDSKLLLISPTATDIQEPEKNAFTLWERQRRHGDVARDLARFLGGDAGLRRLAVLYPLGPLGQSSYRSFAEAAQEVGAQIVASSAYRPDTTTFRGPIDRIAAAAPEAIFVDAEAGPTVLQLTPQIPYYGVEGTIIAGSALWGEPDVLRRLEGTLGNAWIVGTYVDRTAEASPWATFEDLYEMHYRKSLRGNMLPALGYDAMRVVLTAIARSGTGDPARVSRAARELEIAGATGLFRLDPGSSTVARRTLIRALRDGALYLLDVASLLTWRDVEAEEAARRAKAEKEGG